MHSRISQHGKSSAKHSKPKSIARQSLNIKPERAENSRTGYFDIDTVLVVSQREVLDLVDDETFEAIVEN